MRSEREIHTIEYGLKIEQSKLILVLLSILFSLTVSALSFLIRTTYFSDLGLIETNFIRAARMTLIYVIFPYLFTRTFLDPSYSIEDVGLTIQGSKKGVYLGIILYTVVLAILINQLGDSDFKSDWVDSLKSESLLTLVFYAFLASWMAAITDLWARGYILFQICKYSSFHVGILFQTLIWMLIHWYEIDLLTPNLGFLYSFTLTLFLGIGGGFITLKTRNITGLVIGHIWLNIGFLLAVKIIL
ncbi:MAG: type II CAAX prenyl endopeptidase Rce1 family protein [Promethearchaeota archaeon]